MFNLPGEFPPDCAGRFLSKNEGRMMKAFRILFIVVLIGQFAVADELPNRLVVELEDQAAEVLRLTGTVPTEILNLEIENLVLTPIFPEP